MTITEYCQADTHIVIGSGPSSVSCAAALLAGGKRVLLLDGGRSLSPEKQVHLSSLAGEFPYRQPPAELYAAEAATAGSGSDLKLAYGSAFAYALDEMENLDQKGTRCVTSLASGGLSNVWGGAILPVREEEIVRWPVGFDDLRPHYDAVSRLVGMRGVKDDLANLFPLADSPGELPPSSTLTQRLLDHFAANRVSLSAAGITAGRSRLAMRSPHGTNDCILCARCLSGCPYDLIYRSTQTLSDLLGQPGLTYRPGFRVNRVASVAGQVSVHATSSPGGEETVFLGSRAFVGAGPLATARIVAASVSDGDFLYRLQYHPYFLLPVFCHYGATDPGNEPLHTLAQAFIELVDPSISEYSVHMQLYTYSAQMQEAVDRVVPSIPFLRRTVERRLMGRLAVIQGYFHSSHGLPIEGRIETRSAQSRMSLRGNLGRQGQHAIRRTIRTLWRNRRVLGLTPLAPLARIGRPGEGNHIGGSFPMSSKPSQRETNVLGELADLPRVHLVDASVLPDLPASTITLTVMANAHRIGTLVARLRD